MNLRLIKRSGAFLLAALVLLGIAGCSGQGDIQIGNKTLPRDSENLALCPERDSGFVSDPWVSKSDEGKPM